MAGTDPKKIFTAAAYTWPDVSLVEGSGTRRWAADLIRLIDDIVRRIHDDFLTTRFRRYTPTGSADAAGQEGDITYDAGYIYRKDATGWKRATLNAF